MKSKWEEYKEKLGDTRPWDMIDPRVERVTEEMRDRRYSLCQECPQFISLTTQCKECGCVMSAKTKLLNATCPIGKW
jgi:hypothetical protein